MRRCPKCGFTDFAEVPILGLAPLNFWTDIICLHCDYRFAKSSHADKLAKQLAKER